MKKEIKLKKGETRKEYLARVTIFYLENMQEIFNEEIIPIYDEAECDWFCLADDIKIEYNLDR